MRKQKRVSFVVSRLIASIKPQYAVQSLAGAELPVWLLLDLDFDCRAVCVKAKQVAILPADSRTLQLFFPLIPIDTAVGNAGICYVVRQCTLFGSRLLTFDCVIR